MNNQTIHTPISKIVEAINNSLNTMSPPYTKSQTLKLVTEALASLGGEEPKGEWRVFETATALGDTGDYMHSTGITDGKNTLLLEDETDEDDILVNIAKKLNSHPSEREVLERFAHFINTEYNINMSIQGHIIDRYLVLKHKTVEK